jgi:hypothetical protein
MSAAGHDLHMSSLLKPCTALMPLLCAARSMPADTQEQAASGAAKPVTSAHGLVANDKPGNTHDTQTASHVSGLAPANSSAEPSQAEQGEHQSDTLPGGQSNPAAPALPTALGRPPTPAQLASMGAQAAGALGMMHDFMRKALKLAWFRIGWLCQVWFWRSHKSAFIIHPGVAKESGCSLTKTWLCWLV